MEFDPENMKIRICKKCKGLGFGQDLKGNKFKCAECGGSGRIVVRTMKNEFSMNELNDNLHFDKETMKVHVCKSCDGMGTVNYGSETRDCTDCGGTGRIIEQRIVTEYQLHHIDGLAEPGEDSSKDGKQDPKLFQ